MIAPKILLKRHCEFSKIIIKHNLKTARKIDSNLDKEALKKWDRLYSESKNKGKKVWDSDYYRLDGLKVDGSFVELTLSTIKYSLIKGHHELEKLYELDEEFYTNHISIGSVIKTKDGKFVFGKRNGKTMSKLNVDLIGGGMVKQEVEINNGNDVYKMLLKEFSEEANIAIENIISTKIIGILLSPRMNVIIICYTEINLTQEELHDKFIKENDHEELANLIFKDKNNLDDYLKEIGGYRTLIPELLN